MKKNIKKPAHLFWPLIIFMLIVNCGNLLFKPETVGQDTLSNGKFKINLLNVRKSGELVHVDVEITNLTDSKLLFKPIDLTLFNDDSNVIEESENEVPQVTPQRYRIAGTDLQSKLSWPFILRDKELPIWNKYIEAGATIKGLIYFDYIRSKELTRIYFRYGKSKIFFIVNTNEK